MRASLVIVTKNRLDALRTAISSALRQSVLPEVLVVDDGSTDGTVSMVRNEFPTVRLEQSKESHGYIAQRNRAARIASGEIIFSLDDDAEFSTPAVVEDTLRDFDNRRIGAVAVPHMDTLTGRVVNQPAKQDGRVWCVSSYTGTAHAVRRDLFLRLGGYRQELVHQGEEGDFCVRLLASGHVTRLGSAPVILHHESPRRSVQRMDFFGRRNDVLFAWHNVPMPWLPLHLAATTINGLKAAMGANHPVRMIQGTLSGYTDCFRHWDHRSPVPASVYRLHRKLKKSGPCTLQDIEAQLLPIVQEVTTNGSWQPSHQQIHNHQDA